MSLIADKHASATDPAEKGAAKPAFSA
jgi:hypothetical protein